MRSGVRSDTTKTLPCLCAHCSGGSTLWVIRHLDDFLIVCPVAPVVEFLRVGNESLLLMEATRLSQPGDRMRLLGATCAARRVASP